MHGNQLRGRAEKIAGWLVYLDELYEGLLSRPTETASVSGFDATPRARPCECRAVWRHGRLCLACDNTGWRPLTRQEREESLGVDPYSAAISAGVTIVKDESPSARKARDAERLDSVLAALQRNARIRAGLDVTEGRDSRTFRLVSRKDATLDRILVGLEQLKSRRRDLYEDAHARVLALALIVPGRIERAPVVSA